MWFQRFSLKIAALFCTLTFGAMAAETVTEPIREFGYGVLAASSLTPDGTKFLTGSADGKVRLWDIESENVVQVFSGATSEISSVAFSSDGKRLLVGSLDRKAHLWDVATGELLKTFSGHTHWVNSVAFSPDGKQVLTGSFDRTARLGCRDRRGAKNFFRPYRCGQVRCFFPRWKAGADGEWR